MTSEPCVCLDIRTNTSHYGITIVDLAACCMQFKRAFHRMSEQKSVMKRDQGTYIYSSWRSLLRSKLCKPRSSSMWDFPHTRYEPNPSCVTCMQKPSIEHEISEYNVIGQESWESQKLCFRRRRSLGVPTTKRQCLQEAVSGFGDQEMFLSQCQARIASKRAKERDSHLPWCQAWNSTWCALQAKEARLHNMKTAEQWRRATEMLEERLMDCKLTSLASHGTVWDLQMPEGEIEALCT